MHGKHIVPRITPKAILTPQRQIASARSLSSTLPRPSKAQDSVDSKSMEEEGKQAPKNPSSGQENKRHMLPPKAKTVSQADAELRERLEQLSGGGGASGIEYEDGKPNAMKRSVRNNMFRLI